MVQPRRARGELHGTKIVHTRNNELDYLCGSEFQSLFRRALLGSAIVSAWVSDEGGRLLSGDGSLDEIMCGQRWRSEYVLREVDR